MIESYSPIDWACFIILMVCGSWKLKELIDKYAPIIVNKLIAFVERKSK